MDFDLSQDIVKDASYSSSQLLHNLPSSRLISDNPLIDHSDYSDHSGQRQSAISHHAAHISKTSLLPSPTSTTPVEKEKSSSENIYVSSYQTGSAISKIEEIYEAMTECIIGRRKQFSFDLKSRNNSTRNANEDNKDLPISRRRVVQFPNASPREAWKFTALLRIVTLSHEALVTGNIITKRDMYYRDPELFTKQAIVDRFVDDIAYTLGLKRDAMNVVSEFRLNPLVSSYLTGTPQVAAAKGLVAGSFAIRRRNKSVIDYSTAADSQLVPWVKEIEEIDLLQVKWILVIEKEATFHTLVEKRYWEYSVSGKGILLTAKGYPDIQSRQFLHYLGENHPLIPTYVLVDFDPDGIGIMSTYKYGSVTLAHENEDLSVPSIRWLGLKSTDIMHRGEESEGLLKLTKRDRRVAVGMLQREVCQDDGVEKEWRRQLQIMLMLNTKTEIQVIGNGELLETWLNRELGKQIKGAEVS